MHGRNGDFAVRAPLVLGHEAAGVVTAIGPGVTNLALGQRVAIEAGIMCRNCDYCKKGRYNLCKKMRFCSSASVFPHADGTLQGKMNHPAHVLHPYVNLSNYGRFVLTCLPSLPDSCSFEQAALAEPLSVLIHATRRAGLKAGQTVLVYGVGAIGLLACSVAQSTGAARVVAIDNNQTRLNFAKANGFASQVICLPPTDRAKTTDEQLRRAKENAQSVLSEFGATEGFDVVFECTGAEPVIQMSVHVSRHFSRSSCSRVAFFGLLTVPRFPQTAIAGGKVMLIGMGTRNVMLPLSTAALREVDIQGSFRYANTYPTALELLASGKLKNIEKIITHRFPLQDTKRAFDLLSRGQDEDGNMVLKVMIRSP